MWWPFGRKKEEKQIEKPPAPVDGKVKVQIKDDGIFLVVTPPSGGGFAASTAEACRALDEKGIVDVDMEAVREAIKEAKGTPVLVAPRRPELDRPGRVEIVVAEDEMSAQMELFPPQGGKKVTFEDVKAALAEKGVVHGIDEDLIASAIEEERYYEKFTVAKGTPPVDGEDTKINYHFSLEPAKKPTKLINGSVDYRNLDLLISVEAGALLASLEPATAGKPGRTVLGKTLPAKDGRDLQLKIGKNVELSMDGLSARAKVSGQPSVIQGRLDVLPVYYVPGDVDYSTGNIKFNGDIVVQGMVRDGFTVEATGNVQIYGTVEGATVKAGGNVTLLGGVQGQGKAKIEAGENFSARFADKAYIKAQNITISEAAMHCQLEAVSKIVVEGGRGWLVGGKASAGEEIRARIIGSKLGTSTELEVGFSLQARDELKEIQRKLQEATQKQTDILKTIELLDRGRLPRHLEREDKASLYAKLRKTEEEQLLEIRKLEEKKHQLELGLQQQKHGVVRASQIIHPGVRVTIGRMAYLVRDEISHASLQLDDDAIGVKPY